MVPSKLLVANLLVLSIMPNFLGAQLNFSDRRKPIFAGTWYESDPAKLRAQLERYLQAARSNMVEVPVDSSFSGNEPVAGQVLAAISPHAGYMFSGQTAAFAYDKARKEEIETVFLLGPSHYVGFQGAALPSEKFFATPLGDIAVDTAIIGELAQYPFFSILPEVHRREHSLEMQLPLIKQAFGDVKIVPVIVGSLSDETDARMTGQILRRYVKQNDIVIVSSDFTHFGPRYQYQPFKDNIVENVRKLDQEAFHCLQHGDLEAFFAFKERTEDTICGFYPIAVLLGMLPPGTHATLLKYGTSRDSSMEDEQNSVSYLAIVFSRQSQANGWPAVDNDEEKTSLAEIDKANLLKIARHSLEMFVKEHRVPSEQELGDLVTPAMKRPMGAFVTLYKKVSGGGSGSSSKRDDKSLRGCVGYIWPVKTLLTAVIENAAGAASRDYRFVPVTPEELSEIEIDINALTPPRRVASWKDIVIGRDGVVFYKGGKQAVFLPSVAVDFGWDVEQTLSQLAQKAGCGADAWRQGAQFDVFQAESFEEQH